MYCIFFSFGSVQRLPLFQYFPVLFCARMSRKRLANDVSTEKGKRGVWLVKVPKYLSEQWEANEGNVVGKIVLGKDVKFKCAPGLVKVDPQPNAKTKGSEIPTEYSFLLHDIVKQSLSVISEDKGHLGADIDVKTGRLSVEGRIVKKAECRPPDSLSYLKMKQEHIVKRITPVRKVIQIDKAAVKYKPVSVHEEDVMRLKQKKEGAKAYRADKDVLRQALFNAFEKHQYYRLSDLQQLTQNPANYVKEILQEIAVYNTAPPHKSMWELKPEYRNYTVNKPP